MKYPIKKEFYPYAYFTPPIPSARIAGGLGAMLRPPRSLFRDPSLNVERRRIFSADGEEIELLLISPKDVKGKTGALVYYHGGGFLFGATWYHYRIVARYAKEIPLRVIFVQYRLAPKHLHPLPAEDCYAALRWTYENAEELSVDRERIAVAGDSAGGALTAAVCQMARDRGTDLPRAQMMIYPVTDRRMQTPSQQSFLDTPIWNARLSRKMWRAYLGEGEIRDVAYASPMEAASIVGLPRAYVETAEFDCLHDEGIAYAEALRAAGGEVTVVETEGTMHGFDIAERAPTTVAAVERRIAWLKKTLEKE